MQASPAQIYSRNVLFSLLKIAVFCASGMLLPAFLTHHLTSAVYGGWILILQLANFITYLDLGLQSAIAKYIAEYTARSDDVKRDQYASTGIAIMLVLSGCGLLLIFGLVLLVPHLFQEMPQAMAKDVTNGTLMVGASTIALLGASPFAAFFIGLQRYAIPTFMSISNKVLFAASIIVLVERRRSLTEMGAAVALINVLSAICQVAAWRILLPEIRVRIERVAWPIAKEMLGYCAVLGVWNTGMLLITGLDTTLVGHFEFGATAYYAVAAVPINFLALILQATLNPLMPAVSALSTVRTSRQLGMLLVRSTRYVTLALEVFGLPLFMFGYLVLYIWVGAVYAQNSLVLMRVLILAHILRNVCGPYATMVIATGRQRAATLSGVCEAIVNLVSSLILGKYYGATGVAAGTLIGAAVGVLMHLVVSAPRTQPTLSISPGKLFKSGMVRPISVALPTLLFAPLVWSPGFSRHLPAIVVVWAIATVPIAWFVAITQAERNWIMKRLALAERAPQCG